MKLLIIQGNHNSGKTTLCAVLHNELVTNHGARVVHLSKEEYANNLIPIPINEDTPDFCSVLEVKGKRIAIISQGDEGSYVKKQMDYHISKFEPDIMVVCSIIYNTEKSTIRMLLEHYRILYNQENIVKPIWSNSPNEKATVKKSIVLKLIKKMEL